MAGEKRDTALEGLVIQSLISAGVIDGFDKANWDEKISGYRWKPDIRFFVNEKEFVVFVNYSGSETHSKEKFWRTMAELIDAKTASPDAVCIAIFAGDRLRIKELEVTKTLLDATLSLPDRIDEGWVVDEQISTLLESGSRKTSIRNSLEEGVCSEFCESLGRLIKGVVNFKRIKASAETATLLKLNSSRPKLHISPRDTKTRQGLAKLALLSDEVLKGEITPETVLEKKPYMQGLIQLGIVRQLPKTSNVVISDPDIIKIIRANPHAGKAALAGLTRTGSDSRSIIWEKGNIPKAFNELQEVVINTSRNLFAESNEYGFHHGFIYKIAKAWLAVCGSRQGSGWIEDVVDASGTLRSILVGTIFPPFERGETIPERSLLSTIGNALGSRIRQARKSATSTMLAQDCKSVVDYILERELKDRMLCHGIDWGYGALSKLAEEEEVPFEKYRLPSYLATVCGGSANDFSTEGALLGSKIYAHCKSVSKAGKDHKLKELCARAFFFQILRKLEPDSHSPDHLALVMDGCWTPEDVRLLGLFGWDSAYMPDEIELLIQSKDD